MRPNSNSLYAVLHSEIRRRYSFTLVINHWCVWSQEALLPVAGVPCALRFARMNEWIDHCTGNESLFLFFPPVVPPGGRGGSSLPPHPLTTIDSALRFKGTSLRSIWHCSWNVHCVSSHAGDGLFVFVESGSSASGRRRTLRFEVCAYERMDRPLHW